MRKPSIRRRLWRDRKWSILTIVWAVVVVPIALYLAFTNPDMTRTRLFLTYWPVYTIIITTGIGISILRGWFE